MPRWYGNWLQTPRKTYEFQAADGRTVSFQVACASACGISLNCWSSICRQAADPAFRQALRDELNMLVGF